MHAQAKHVHMEASSRDEIKRLKSQIAGLRGENQHLRAETQRLHSNLATTQLQLRHYGQQVLCSWLRLLTAHAWCPHCDRHGHGSSCIIMRGCRS